MDFKELRAKI